MTSPTRRLAAIMFTDIVGYTALMAESEERGLRARERHRALVRPLVERYHGDSIEARGDESLSTFPTALDAVNCALAIEAAARDDADLKLHLGIHLGDVIVQDGEVSGDGVNIASRICALSEGGGICVSGEVYQSVRNQPDMEAVSLGERELKNVGRLVAVYALGRPGTVVVGSARQSSPSSWNRGRSMVAALALAVVALITWRIWDQVVIAPGPIRSIAVLPLDNLSGDPEQEYFADGMTEVLIASLARIGGLRVISRTSSMAYKNSDRTLPQIASELNVDAVVEGSVMRAGDRVRITTQLIRADSDEHLWSDSYERDLEDVLALQREVAGAIADEIELKLAPAQAQGGGRPVDPEAFEGYLKGRHHWNKRTGADIRKSIEYFETAIALDPDWALAHSGLAQAYVLLAPFDPSERPRDSMPRARAAAERALELDDELAPAHTALAGVRMWYDWDWEGAEAEFQRALELDPSYATAHHWYALHRLSMKKQDALEHIQRARELDPLSMIIGTIMGQILLFAREYDRSIETLRETLELDPGFTYGQVSLARAYAAKGMHEEAVEVAERLARTDPGSRRGMVTLALAYAGAGQREDALRILEEVRGSALYPPSVAYVYAALGEADAAFEWLEKAYERRSIGVTWIRVDPGFDPIRSDPRWDDLMRRIGFPES